jgi:hypothetical protein
MPMPRKPRLKAENEFDELDDEEVQGDELEAITEAKERNLTIDAVKKAVKDVVRKHAHKAKTETAKKKYINRAMQQVEVALGEIELTPDEKAKIRREVEILFEGGEFSARDKFLNEKLLFEDRIKALRNTIPEGGVIDMGGVYFQRGEGGSVEGSLDGKNYKRINKNNIKKYTTPILISGLGS